MTLELRGTVRGEHALITHVVAHQLPHPCLVRHPGRSVRRVQSLEQRKCERATQRRRVALPVPATLFSYME